MIKIAKAGEKIFAAIALAVVFAILFPVFVFLLGQVHALAVHVVWLTYLILGVMFIFYGLSGRRKRMNWIILGTAFIALGLASVVGLAINYIYAAVVGAA